MANRLPLLGLALASSMFLVTGLTAAHAADPAFCRQYAQAAIN